jgi:putative endonuclease
VSLLGRLRGRIDSGASGEGLACRHLEARGYAILERNFRCRSGEIDVVARENDATVFVEVKDRTGESHGAGHEAVTFGKRRRILRAARLYAASRGLEDTPLRFDVISIERGPDGPRVQHYEDAFGEDG